jgi:hypothetical protein
MLMQRLRLTILCCALLALAAPGRTHAQTSATTCYANVDLGVLGLNLRPFRMFQQLNALGDFAGFLDTDDGTVHLPMIGGRIGVAYYDPSTFNGCRVEARGFYASGSEETSQVLPAGTAFALITGGEGSEFISTTIADFERDVTVTGGDFLFKWDCATSNRTIVAPYVGVSFLSIDQEFNVVAVDQVVLDRMTLNDNVRGTYWGASIGIECLTRIFPTTTCIVDFRLSGYELRAERQARQVDVISFSDVQLSQETSRFTGAAMVRFELTQELRWAQLSLFGSAQYFEAPFVDYGRSFDSATNFTPSQLEIGDAFGYTAGVSVCVPF